MLEERVETLSDTRSPVTVVFDFRRVGDGAVRSVTLDTDLVENLLAFAFAYRNAVAQGELPCGLDTGLSGGFGRLVNVCERAAARQFDEEVNDCNGNNDTAHKGKQCRALGF